MKENETIITAIIILALALVVVFIRIENEFNKIQADLEQYKENNDHTLAEINSEIFNIKKDFYHLKKQAAERIVSIKNDICFLREKTNNRECFDGCAPDVCEGTVITPHTQLKAEEVFK